MLKPSLVSFLLLSTLLENAMARCGSCGRKQKRAGVALPAGTLKKLAHLDLETTEASMRALDCLRALKKNSDVRLQMLQHIAHNQAVLPTSTFILSEIDVQGTFTNQVFHAAFSMYKDEQLGARTMYLSTVAALGFPLGQELLSLTDNNADKFFSDNMPKKLPELTHAISQFIKEEKAQAVAYLRNYFTISDATIDQIFGVSA